MPVWNSKKTALRNRRLFRPIVLHRRPCRGCGLRSAPTAQLLLPIGQLVTPCHRTAPERCRTQTGLRWTTECQTTTMSKPTRRRPAAGEVAERSSGVAAELGETTKQGHVDAPHDRDRDCVSGLDGWA